MACKRIGGYLASGSLVGSDFTVTPRDVNIFWHHTSVRIYIARQPVAKRRLVDWLAFSSSPFAIPAPE